MPKRALPLHLPSSNMLSMLELIKKLRESTECSIGDCKKALDEAKGDFEKAKTVLMLSAAKTAAKKSARETKEGIVATYLHSNNKIGVMIELLSETDFVAKNAAFSDLAHNIALHIAAMNPQYISIEEIPKDVYQAVYAQAEEEVAKMGKSSKIAKDIVEGKVQAYFGAQSLLSQSYVKDQDKTISDLMKEAIAKFGENIKVARFARFEL